MAELVATNVIAVIYENTPVMVKLADNETGYLNILKQNDVKRSKPYYAKFSDPGDGNKQKTLNGSSSATAEEAACKLAYFLAGHAGELPPKKSNLPRRSSEVCLPAICLQYSHSLSHLTVCARIAAQEVKAERLAKREARELEREGKRQAKIQRLQQRSAGRACSSLALHSACNLPFAVAVPFGSPVPMSELQSPVPVSPDLPAE